MIQAIRRNATTWEVNRFSDLWKGAHECELIGRIIKDADGRFYIDLPVWKEEGCEWERQTRGYLLLHGALRAIEKYIKVVQ